MIISKLLELDRNPTEFKTLVYKLAEEHPRVFKKLTGLTVSKFNTKPFKAFTATDVELSNWKVLAKTDKIEMVRTLRHKYSVGLKEAKEEVDSWGVVHMKE